MGYAEGGLLSRQVPGWQVIAWALVLALPVTVPVAAASAVIDPPRHVGPASLAGFGYVAVFSMFLGFCGWYPGLAVAGISRGSQVQLLQPLLTVGWAALLLGEAISPVTVAAAAGVLACVGLAQRAPVRAPPPAPEPCLAARARDEPRENGNE
jgi:drug/metabolite transporter (DMT)-like permease